MSLKKKLLHALAGIDGCCLDTEEERVRARDHLLAWMHAEMPTPLYPHEDCSACHFVGQVVHEHHGLCDVYEHVHTSSDQRQVFGATIIARYGPEGHEYASMDEKILERGISPGSVLNLALDLVVARREVHPPQEFKTSPGRALTTPSATPP